MSVRCCVCLWTTCAAPEEARHPGTGATHRWAMGINPGRLQAKQELVIFQPSLQPSDENSMVE